MSQFKSFLDTYFEGDRVIWSILFILGIFSLPVVYSAGAFEIFRGGGGSPEGYLIKQAIFVVGGWALAYFCYKVYYQYYSKLAPWLYLIAVLLMIYTNIWGVEKNDAIRWMKIPILNYNFQTSDLAKFALIIFTARVLAINQNVIKSIKGFIPVFTAIMVMCLLIGRQDLSTSLLLFITCFSMMFVGRIKFKYVLVMFLGGVMVFAIAYLIAKQFPEQTRVETWENRIDAFLHRTPYQVEQSKIAIANGGFKGVGVGDSTQRNHLPYAYADFVYAIICEEYGLIGAIAVLGSYFVLLWRSMRIVARCKKAFGIFLVVGLSFNIVIQAYANIAVAINLMPATGVTLPIISMGGTSLIFTCISIGIILGVSKYVDDQRVKTINKELKTQTDESNH